MIAITGRNLRPVIARDFPKNYKEVSVMIKLIKKITHNKKHRYLAVLCILCVAVIGVSMWIFPGKGDPVGDDNNPGIPVDLGAQQVPLGNISTAVSAGDTVIVNVFADIMDDVYGYQFDINFDSDIIKYGKRLYSDIGEIATIFAKDKEWYLLVGATMTDFEKGFSGRQVSVCHVEFAALADFELSPDLTSDHITISSVNTVTGDSQYLENVDGWTVRISVK